MCPFWGTLLKNNVGQDGILKNWELVPRRGASTRTCRISTPADVWRNQHRTARVCGHDPARLFSNVEQFDLENQSGAAGNRGRVTGVAVGDRRRAHQACLAAD